MDACQERCMDIHSIVAQALLENAQASWNAFSLGNYHIQLEAWEPKSTSLHSTCRGINQYLTVSGSFFHSQQWSFKLTSPPEHLTTVPGPTYDIMTIISGTDHRQNISPVQLLLKVQGIVLTMPGKLQLNSHLPWQVPFSLTFDDTRSGVTDKLQVVIGTSSRILNCVNLKLLGKGQLRRHKPCLLNQQNRFNWYSSNLIQKYNQSITWIYRRCLPNAKQLQIIIRFRNVILKSDTNFQVQVCRIRTSVLVVLKPLQASLSYFVLPWPTCREMTRILL